MAIPSAPRAIQHKDGAGAFQLRGNQRVPVAPAPVLGGSAAPKYLVRDDGYVIPWNPTLARNPRFSPSNQLPQEHLDSIALSQQRQQTQAAALAERRDQIDLDKADKMAIENRLLKERLAALESLRIAGAPPVDEVQLRTDELRISKLTKQGLIAYALAEFRIDISADLPDTEVREKVRQLQQARRAAPKSAPEA